MISKSYGDMTTGKQYTQDHDMHQVERTVIYEVYGNM